MDTPNRTTKEELNGATPDPGTNPKARGMVRETLEAMTVAIVMALTIKQFALEAYKVPTGSMEPTIMGAEDGGDRILVDKLAYMLRDPRRWEVVVFKYPNNRTINYIKRIVGLPNETMFILGGDIYTAPFGSERSNIGELYAAGSLRIQPKPKALQDEVFSRYPQIKLEHRNQLTSENFIASWWIPPSELPDRDDWTFREGAVRARAVERSLATFRQTIRDNRKDIPPGATNRGGRNQVGDIRLEFEARPAAEGGSVVIALKDGHHDLDIEARLPIQGCPDSGGLFLGGELVADLGKVVLQPETWTRVTFTNVDNVLALQLDGERVARHAYDHPPETRRFLSDTRQSLGFGIKGAEVDFRSPGVWRDLYFETGKLGRIDIPGGHYFVLGDNSPSSKDSREWEMLEIRPQSADGRTIRGDSEAVLDPRDLTSRIPNPWWDEGHKHRYFMDQYGNIHDITEGGMGEVTRRPSPLVPRNLVTGRAFAVFLPIDRIKLVK